jgi:hypothetical protein
MHTASLVHQAHVSTREAFGHGCFDVVEVCFFAGLGLDLSLVEESLHRGGGRVLVFRQLGGHGGRVSWYGNGLGNDWN